MTGSIQELHFTSNLKRIAVAAHYPLATCSCKYGPSQCKDPTVQRLLPEKTVGHKSVSINNMGPSLLTSDAQANQFPAVSAIVGNIMENWGFEKVDLQS